MKTTRELTLERYSTHLGRSPEMTAHIVRSLERCFADWLPADRNAPILDAGCGEGNLLAFLRAKGYANLSGFDLSPECVRLCRERGLEFVIAHDAAEVAGSRGRRKGGRSFSASTCWSIFRGSARRVFWRGCARGSRRTAAW